MGFLWRGLSARARVDRNALAVVYLGEVGLADDLGGKAGVMFGRLRILHSLGALFTRIPRMKRLAARLEHINLKLRDP